MRKYIIALVIIVLAFNGLNNLREITDLAIVKAIGLDMTEDGNIKATVIVLDTEDKENTGKGIIYEAEGKSVQEAVRFIVDESPKKLYVAHMENLILSEQIARENLENTLDFFIRDNEGSNNFFLFVASGSEASEVINVINEEEISMKEMILSSVKYRGNCNQKTLNDIIKDLLREGKDIAVNSCEIENGMVNISEMAYFKGWNMQGYLTDEESIIHNLITNNLENTVFALNSNSDLIDVEVISSNNKMKLNKEKNEITMKINIDANISETGKNIQINNSKDVDKLESQLEEKIKDKVNEYIVKMRDEYKCDLIGLGNFLYRKKSDIFNQEDYLSKINIKLDVNVNLLNEGGVTKRW